MNKTNITEQKSALKTWDFQTLNKWYDINSKKSVWIISVITYAPDVAAHCALGNMQLYCPNLDHLILGQIKLTLIKAKPHIHSHAFAVWKLRFGVRFLESELWGQIWLFLSRLKRFKILNSYFYIFQKKLFDQISHQCLYMTIWNRALISWVLHERFSCTA